MGPNLMQCYDENPCDKQFKSFINNTCEQYKRIERKLVSCRPSYRICCLSIPRSRIRKYKPPIAKCCIKRDIEIIHPNEFPYTTSTRVKQLAFPSVRKLLEQRNEFKKVLGPERYHLCNRHIREGLLSVYSRLANIQQPPRKEFPKKWTPEEWKLMTRKLRRLATPKKAKLPPKIRRPQKTLKEMKKSIRKLSRPRKYIEYPPNQWVFTDQLKNYKMSKVIQTLTVVKEKPEDICLPLPIPVSEAAKSYTASARVKELAMHRERRATIDGEGVRDNPFEISPNALKAKASKRTKELAEPKELENPAQKEIPWKVSPNALKAKASQRIIELSQPRGQKE